MSNLPLPPGGSGLPMLGEMLPFLLNPNFLGERNARHGPIIRTQLFGRPTAVMFGPEANRFILADGMHHFSWKEGWPFTFQELLGQSLFVMDGEAHRQKRRLMMPAFHRQAIAGYMAEMERIVQKYLQMWAQRGEFAWFVEFKRLTFEVACALLLGSEPGDDTAHLSQHFTDLTNGFFTAPLRWRFTPYGKALRARDAILQFVETAVRRRQAAPQSDALSLLVQSRDETGAALSLAELKAQAVLLLFAGHETTTSMLSALCLALAQHPAVLARLRAEQQAVSLTGPLTYDTFKEFPYLEQVLMEVERLYPPVPGGFRGVVEEFVFNGYRVPKGWMVLYNIPHAQMNPAYFANPQAFDPDRFGPERAEHKKVPPYSMVTFGGGARLCLGMTFAQIEMKIVAVHLIRSYAWALCPGQDLTLARIPTARPKDNLQVRFWRQPGT